MVSWSLAIDFGTSNTAASYRIGTGPAQPVRLSDQAHQMPSAVLFTEGGIRVGTEAVRAQRVAPENFLESPKLHLGQDAVFLGQADVEVLDLVSAVLGHAALRAVRAAGGSKPDLVVLTHPYEWAQPRKAALRAAWDRAGVPSGRVELVSEPVAAISWFAHTAQPPKGSYVGVLDVGGGTCDVAVLRHTGEMGQPFRIVGHGGQDDLGGITVDNILLDYVRRTLTRLGHSDLHRSLSLPEHRAALLTLRDHVRQAKHALSDWEDATVPIVVGNAEATVIVTASELERLVRPVVTRMVAVAQRALAGAGVVPAELHALYLTGGSSHLRPVAAAMADLLGGRPATLDDPKLVVALGAHDAATCSPPYEVETEPRVEESTWWIPVDSKSARAQKNQAGLGSRAEKSSLAWWLVAAAIAVAVIGGLTVLIVGTNSSEGTIGASTNSAEGTSGGPTSSAEDRLTGLLPPGAGTCTPESPQSGTSATVTCMTSFTTSLAEKFTMSSRFTLFEDIEAMQSYFEAQIGGQIKSVRATCPQVEGTTTYEIVSGVMAGQLACYHNGTIPAVTWTRDDALVVGQVEGPAGTDLGATWEWWQRPGSRIGAP